MTKMRVVNAAQKASVTELKEVYGASAVAADLQLRLVLKGHQKADETSIIFTVVGLSCVSP